MPFEDFERAFLACYFAFVAVSYTGKLIGARERAGFAHDDKGPRGTSQYVAHSLFHWFRAAILAVCVARVFWPGLDQFLVMLPVLDVAPVKGFGIAAMLAALGWVAYVDSYLGNDWRSGVPGRMHAPLMTGGPYRRTRNPAFLGVLAGQAGFFLALPSVFTLFCLAVGVVAVVRQADYEEARLTDRYGDEYRAYAARTPKWIPVWRQADPGRGVTFRP